MRLSLRRLFGLESGKPLFSPLALSRYYRHQAGEDDYLRLYFEAMKNTSSTDNFAKQNRFYTLYQTVRNLLRRNLPGDVAECGCWRGHSTYLTASLLKRASWQGRFWVFDSFEGGLSDKTAEDRVMTGNTGPEATARQKAWFASSFEEVSRALAGFPFVGLHKGWIPDVFRQPGLEDRRFSFVHIDVDLYQPTRDSLVFFFDRLVDGGAVLIDDYGYAGFPGAQQAVDEFIGGRDHQLLLEGHLGGALIVK